MFQHQKSTDYSSLNAIVPASISSSATKSFKVPVFVRWQPYDPEHVTDWPTAASIGVCRTDELTPLPHEDVVLDGTGYGTRTVRFFNIGDLVSNGSVNTVMIYVGFDTDYDIDLENTTVSVRADGIEIVNSQADDTAMYVVSPVPGENHSALKFTFGDYPARLGKLLAAQNVSVEITF